MGYGGSLLQTETRPMGYNGHLWASPREPMATLSMPLWCSSPLHCQPPYYIFLLFLPVASFPPTQSVSLPRPAFGPAQEHRKLYLPVTLKDLWVQCDTRDKPIPLSVLLLPAGVSPQHNCLTNTKMGAASLPTTPLDINQLYLLRF